MITERTLKKWRREALKSLKTPKILITENSGVDEEFLISEIELLNNQILRMTQELLDQNLLKKGN